MMKKRGSSKLAAMVCTIVLVMTFARTDVFAAYSGTADVTAGTTIEFDSEHSIYVQATSHVDYSYDEGAYGWIDDSTADIYIGSNDVHPDECTQVDYGGYGESRAYIRYYIYCYRWTGDFSCYINVYVHCDEWGELYSWIEYDSVTYRY